MEPRPANELVEHAVGRLSAAAPAELAPGKRKRDATRRVAEALRLTGDSQQRVYRWGATGPKYRDTVLLLDLCGFLTVEGRTFLGLERAPGDDLASAVDEAVALSDEVSKQRPEQRSSGRRRRGTG